MRWRTWVGNGLLVVLGTVIALALAEVAVRTLAPRGTSIAYSDRYGLALLYPDITRYRPRFDRVVSTNDAGMRDRDHDRTKPEGTFRVMVLGDSFMEAQQVAFEASMPALLESELGGRTPQSVEVINAGVSGWGTDDQLRYLTEYGLAYEPDLIVVAMTLHNDVSDNLRQYWHTLRDGELVAQDRDPIPWLTYKSLQLKAFLAVNFELVQVVREARHLRTMRAVGQALESHVHRLFRDPAPQEIEFGWDLTEQLFGRMQSVAADHGARVAVVLLPIRHQLSEEMFDDVIGSGRTSDGWELDRERPQRIMRDIAEELSLPLIDLTPGFRSWVATRDEPLYIEWDGHWNEAGHRLAAQIVTSRLQELDVVDARPPSR